VVEPDSPADRAGIKAGDLITGAGGTPVTSGDELFAQLDALAEGDTLALHIVRGVDELDVEVSFAPTGESAQSEGEVAD
jgi:S1-C subfamily serine protease